jgi:cytochrome P450
MTLQVQSSGVARASAADTAKLAATVLAPLLATGVIVRRPRVMELAEKMQLDGPAVRLFADLRSRYGPGPLRVDLPGRSIILPLSPEDVSRVLDGSPEPFTPANLEKRAALAQFQPHGVLISHGEVRTDRRRFNEAVLETDQPVHHLSDAVVAVVRQEARGMLSMASAAGHLGWDDFAEGWWRIVRRVVFGEGARDDHVLTDQLKRLRAAGNWSVLSPQRTRLREAFLGRLRGHLDRAEPGSLAHLVVTMPSVHGVDPAGQVPHWLFAFDAAGMATFRTLALLATHETQELAAREDSADPAAPAQRARLRAALLDSLRLWPTTPAILRDSTTDTDWGGVVVPEGSAFLVYTPFFHRDEATLPFAHQFEPDIWLDGRAAEYPALVPFSAGPAGCPGRNLVLFTTSTLLASFLDGHRFRLVSGPRLAPERPLPFTINNFGLDFAVEPTT